MWVPVWVLKDTNAVCASAVMPPVMLVGKGGEMVVTRSHAYVFLWVEYVVSSRETGIV